MIKQIRQYKKLMGLLSVTFILILFTAPANAQFSFGTVKENAIKDQKEKTPKKTEANDKTDSLLESLKGEQKIWKFRVGMVFEAHSKGPCTDVLGTIPVPMDFPEQKVRIIEENFPRTARVYYRELKEGGVKQLVLKMRNLRGGQKVEATVLMEVTRYAMAVPKETQSFVLPKKMSRKIKQYLKEGPYMEVNSSMVQKAAKEAVTDKKSAWDKMEAIFKYVRDHVQYKEELKQGTIRGALSALRNKSGDCEDMCALFISMCRAQNIPARLVWVEGHCFSEFYLEDSEERGHWFPAQVAGTEPVGGMTDNRIIYQKGDNFKIPEDPKATLPYVKELFMGEVAKQAPNPKYHFIKEILDN